MTRLTAENLTCVRGGRIVCSRPELSASRRAGAGVEGANGAGKTSLLRLIAGFLTPARGPIRLQTNGGDVADAEERGKFVGWLGHQDAVKPQLTVREKLQFFARLYGSRGSDRLRAGRGWPRASGRVCLPLSLRRAEEAAGAGAAHAFAAVRSGCWTSLSRRWITAGKKIAADLIATHCAGGGIVIAATHEPLGIACERLSAVIALLVRDIRLAARAAAARRWRWRSSPRWRPGAAGRRRRSAGCWRGSPAACCGSRRCWRRCCRWIACSRRDFEDGSLDLIALSPLSLEQIALAKIAAHWLSTGLPLTMLSPLLALLFGLPAQATAALFVSLLIGTPAVSAIGAIGASLTLSLQRGGLILPLIILPLLAPAVIFGAGAVLSALDGLSNGALPLLAAFSFAACVLSPFATAAAVRLNLGS